MNDDTVLESTGWTEKLIEQLLRFHPPNVGVAGPWFRDGNIAIMTHDFVHKTHIDIFGFYYPRVFTDWFADGKFLQDEKFINISHSIYNHVFCYALECMSYKKAFLSNANQAYGLHSEQFSTCPVDWGVSLW